ncbi:class I SAM-dependent methyltransferase [Prolixibacteraceae bacterium Z1-6]|uniref:Class I SAM-dependent methyltransferase n=1 Tax=Draconibacterium aestuarii TaxID=2998507 RepID=A0A9X3F8P1_9BACT|nr:class I SAM-dependent methyltransferase [Prolixibacteraceae bacterium Z1-6]
MDIREYVKNPIQGAILHPWESARIEVVLKLLNQHKKRASNLNIFDIGCGDAKVINTLSKQLKESTFIGIDTALDEELISQLQNILNNPNIKLYKDSKDLTKQNSIADVVLLLDIIEHIEKDADFLAEITSSNYISKDTNVIITVPAFQSLYVNRDTWLGHYRRYTIKMLTELATKNNLEIVQTGYFFSSLVPVRFLQKITERESEPNGYLGINNWNGSKWSADLLKNILVIDYKIGNVFNNLGIKLPGLSCYMICKKQ